jgi:hypothetical protein
MLKAKMSRSRERKQGGVSEIPYPTLGTLQILAHLVFTKG